jgi:hypothetical protein
VSLAQRFERRLESLVGGAFARVFKGQVEPVEIGSALQREATDKRNVMGNGRVLAPNRYRVTLSPSDHDRLAPWALQLTTSLAELVQEHLDENHWETVGDIEVFLAVDDQLHTGVFGVASRMDSAAPPRTRPHDSMSLPMVAVDFVEPHERPVPPQYSAPQYPAPQYPAPQYPPSAPPPVPAPQQHAALTVDGTGRRFELRRGGNVIGRGSESDLQLLDQGVSRKHINVDYDGVYATVHDLGSTNGTTINGHPVGSQVLQHGDVIRLGHTKLVFHQDLA